DRKSTRLNSSHVKNSYAVFCLKKKTVHEHRQWLRDTNGVRHLHNAPPREPTRYNTLSSLSYNVGSTPVILGRVLPRESTTAMCTPTTVSVDDDLTSGLFFNAAATTEIYTLSLHDALPI